MHFKIDWASLIVESKFTIFALFSLYLRAICPSTSPRGAYNYLEGRFNRGSFCVTGLGGLYLEGLIHGGAYFRNFMVYHFCQVQIEVSEKAIFSDLSFHTNLMMSLSVNAVKF